MHSMPLAGSDALLRQARQALHSSGALPDGLLPPALEHVSRSWRRSAAAGVHAYAQQAQAPHLSRFEVARATESQHELLAHARPVMEYLHGQTLDSGSMVILADADGLLLHALGDAGFLNRAERVALMPGASWHEQYRGTNAIGTALAEAAPVVVHGAEHFLECNGFLTCAAAPIVAPDGQVLGVLDISGERRSRHPHTFGMVRAATQMIENRLFEARHGRQVRLHFHPLAEGIGTLAEGVLALSDDGMLVGANQAALGLLGLRAGQLGRVSLQQLLDADMDELLRRSHRHSAALQVRCHSSASTPVLFVRVEAGWMRPATWEAQPAARPPVPAAASAAKDALDALDAGDAAWHATLQKVRKVLDQPIALMLQGESGAGKEVLAKAIHASSARSRQAFVAVNCAALPESLIEAELFGYAPGAYTGARREGAQGSIRQAHQGTLFLDEIGDMPLAMQTRLLRVLQDRKVTPLGAGQPVDVDFALICATHRNLKTEVAEGRFRADLYWRLNGLALHIPALRQRSDLPVLIRSMLDQLAPGRQLQMAPSLQQALAQYHWPGNLRQLDNVLRTALALLGDEPVIDWRHVADDLRAELEQGAGAAAHPPLHAGGAGHIGAPQSLSRTLAQSTRDVLERAIEAAGGNVSMAARRLGISRNTLYRRLRQRQ